MAKHRCDLCNNQVQNILPGRYCPDCGRGPGKAVPFSPGWKFQRLEKWEKTTRERVFSLDALAEAMVEMEKTGGDAYTQDYAQLWRLTPISQSRGPL